MLKEPDVLNVDPAYPPERLVANFAAELSPKVSPYIPDLPRFYLARGGVTDLAIKLVSGKSGPEGQQSLAPPVDSNPKYQNLNGAGLDIRLAGRCQNCLNVFGVRSAV